jgi:hypothetical protein
MARASAVRRLRSAVPQSKKISPPPGPIDPNVYYVDPETAAFLRLTNPKTLGIWRCRGTHPELIFVKRFGRVLCKGSSIIAFLDGTAKAPKAETGKTPQPKRASVKALSDLREAVADLREAEASLRQAKRGKR